MALAWSNLERDVDQGSGLSERLRDVIGLAHRGRIRYRPGGRVPLHQKEIFLPQGYLLLHQRLLLSTCVEPLSPAFVTSGAARPSSRFPATVWMVLVWSVVAPAAYLVPLIACCA